MNRCLFKLGLLVGCFFGISVGAEVSDESKLHHEALVALAKDKKNNAKKKLFDLVYEYPNSVHHQDYVVELVALYHQMAKYADCADLAEEYLQDYPRGDYLPYVTFMYGYNTYLTTSSSLQSWLLQGRYGITDVYALEKAMDALSTVVKKYPESPYVHKSILLINEITLKLAKQDLLTSEYYYSTGAYIASMERAQKAKALSDADEVQKWADTLYAQNQKMLKLDQLLD